MPKVTYKDLYSQVVEEIRKEKKFISFDKFNQQLSRAGIAPLAFGGGGSLPDISAGEVIAAVQNLLQETLPPTIIEGLEVTASFPANQYIHITSGKGAVGGKLYTLEDDTYIPVPFDDDTEVFYVNLYLDRLMVEKTKSSDKLTIAKINVPNPGVTNKIFDHADDADIQDGDAYIQTFKEFKLYGINDRLEEDSQQILRNNIGDILADAIVGNLTLSENLKITNTTGTVEIDSRQVLIKDTSGNTSAKFNKDGTFFYNTSGQEVAKFSVGGAKIGNISITPTSIQSEDFISGYEGRGFQINDDGQAQFLNVLVRGQLSSMVFVHDEVQISNGDLYVTSGSSLTNDITSTQTEFEVEDGVFNVDDILYLKTATKSEYMQVTDVDSTNNFITVTRHYDDVSTGIAYSWERGTPIVVMGSRVSIISSGDQSDYLPYIDIVERTGNSVEEQEVRLRLGNLYGVRDDDFGTLEDFGLYADNVFLKGCLFAPNISTAISGARVEFNCSCFSAFDSDDNKVFNLAISGFNAGDLTVGNFGSGNYMFWDNSLCSFTINSCCSGRCVSISSGSICGNDICLFNPLCDEYYSYLDSGALRFHTPFDDLAYAKRVCSGSADAGDTIVLCRWTTIPNIMIGVKELRSYDCSITGCQKWCVYHDSVEYFDNTDASGADPGDFGYCFDVHALLVVEDGSVNSLEQAGFNTCFNTATNTCEVQVTNRFQKWCFCNTSSECYGYGTVNYAIRYRCLGCAVWCENTYTYVQPHSNVNELKTTVDDVRTIVFPACYQWELSVCESSSSFTLSTLCGISQVCCCRAFSGNQLQVSVDSDCDNCFNSGTANINVGGTNPDNVYCAYICVCWCSISTGWSGYRRTHPKNHAGSGNIFTAYVCTVNTVLLCCYESGGGGASAYVGGGWGCTFTFGEGTECCCIDITADTSTCNITALIMCGEVCVHGLSHACAYTFTCFCEFEGCLVQCYDNYPSNEECSLQCAHCTVSKQGTQTILDSNGIVNWLAVAYE